MSYVGFPVLLEAHLTEFYNYYRHAAKMDTPEKHAMLENLAPGATYELVVKAGNSNGTSQLTSPLKFVMAKNYIVQTTNQVRRWT